ncbi:MAG TPA: hypothetical protein PLG90_13340 [Ignavibacteria bacterium]|nr:hypothetical protein [Ignavibacteria bacterium]
MKKNKINDKFLFILLISLIFCNNIFAMDSISLYSNYNFREEPKIKIKNEELKLITSHYLFDGYLFIKINDMVLNNNYYYTDIFWVSKNSTFDSIVYFSYLSNFKILSDMYLGINKDLNDLYYFIKYLKYFNNNAECKFFLYQTGSPINSNRLKGVPTFYLNSSEDEFIVIDLEFKTAVLAYLEGDIFHNFLVPVSPTSKFNILTYNVIEKNLKIMKTNNYIMLRK